MESHDSPSSPPKSKAERFRFIDGLRGIAAVAVVLYHWSGSINGLPGATVVPAFLQQSLQTLWTGVEIFFVISGFVIAHSIHGQRITPRFLGRFALRRSIRLDPPYWLAVVVAATLA